MNTKKKILRIVLVAGLLAATAFCSYAQWIKMKFDKIYENRHNYGPIYQEIYTSGTLETIRTFYFDHFESSVFPAKKSHLYYLYSIDDLTSDPAILSAAGYLRDRGFWRADVYFQDRFGPTKQLVLNKRFLSYEYQSTSHHLVYDQTARRSFRFSPDDDWYFFSANSESDERTGFLDFRPQWTIPYFEAFEFFDGHSNYDVQW